MNLRATARKEPQIPAAPSTADRPAAVPAYLLACAFAATSVIVGVVWDISWHRSIGRDTFWTPAHLAIYLGGALAGTSCGSLVLRTTFAPAAAETVPGVQFWGFRGPIGAWLCIWGALAMITSAPLDNWWHNAYGLDVQVLSPPHTVLALGMFGIQFGALLLALAEQNRSVTPNHRRGYGLLVAWLAGVVIQNASILGLEQIGFANAARMSLYYKVSAAIFPITLVAAGRAARLRWPATTAAAAYMAISLIMIWVLQLFPATPKLAPVFNPITHMVSPPFPMLLVVPAVVIDVLLRRFTSGNDWLLALLTGLGFLVAFVLTQWFFAEFLLSPHARNFFFGIDQWDYSSRVGPWRYEFWRVAIDPVTPRGLGWAALIAVASARVGLWCGDWMARIKR
jgi:hypothetical protein